MKLIIPFVLVTIVSGLILKLIAVPFPWIGLLWFGLFFYWTVVEKRPKIKPVWFNIGFLFLVLAGAETYLWLSEKCDDFRFGGDLPAGQFVSDDILGYAPQKDIAIASEKYFDDTLVYDVTYTIGPNGLRMSPPTNNPEHDCILFFGGSFTFGTGVEDYETLPYLVGTETGYDVYNFGFQGYGPHQMLSAIESGMVEDRIEGCTPRHIIYQAIVDHAGRAAGRARWDIHGPEYILLPDGSIKSTGHFDDHPAPKENIIVRRLKAQLIKSFLYNTVFNPPLVIKDEDVNLMVGIVAASKKLLLEQFPGSDFQVIFWDFKPQDRHQSMVIDQLWAAGLDVHVVGDFIPGYSEDLAEYQIHPCEPHPNATTYRKTAEYILSDIFGRS